MTQERRRYPRHAVDLAVEVSARNELLVGETQTLSLGGVTVVTDDLLERGATIWMTISFPREEDEDEDDTFETSATVRWTRERPDGRCVAGLMFGPLTAAQKKDLARLVETQDASRSRAS